MSLARGALPRFVVAILVSSGGSLEDGRPHVLPCYLHGSLEDGRPHVLPCYLHGSLEDGRPHVLPCYLHGSLEDGRPDVLPCYLHGSLLVTAAGLGLGGCAGRTTATEAEAGDDAGSETGSVGSDGGAADAEEVDGGEGGAVDATSRADAEPIDGDTNPEAGGFIEAGSDTGVIGQSDAAGQAEGGGADSSVGLDAAIEDAGAGPVDASAEDGCTAPTVGSYACGATMCGSATSFCLETMVKDTCEPLPAQCGGCAETIDCDCLVTNVSNPCDAGVLQCKPMHDGGFYWIQALDCL